MVQMVDDDSSEVTKEQEGPTISRSGVVGRYRRPQCDAVVHIDVLATLRHDVTMTSAAPAVGADATYRMPKT